MDHSRGYEDAAEAWMADRGNAQHRHGAVGAGEVAQWARALPPGSSVLDVGCGPGTPLTVLLVEAGMQVYGVDASPSFVAAFQQNLPGVPVACASVLHFDFFGRTFDAVLAIGLIFLLPREDQAYLLRRFAEALAPNGRLLFTAPANDCQWMDVMTGVESVSLGADEYRRQLAAAGLSVDAEFEDAGQNHYFDAHRVAEGTPTSVWTT